MRASRLALVVIAAGVAVYAAFVLAGADRADLPAPVFHATLADAALYGEDGTYRISTNATDGMYELQFVLSGDSPRMLDVSISGNMTSFEETFELLGTRQGTEQATYYTWEYLGNKDVRIGADSTLAVTIDPHGSLQGPVSVILVSK